MLTPRYLEGAPDAMVELYSEVEADILADMASRMERCREKGPAEESLTDRELKQKIQSVDRNRAKYYEFYTGQKWGDRLDYDLCINTTKTSIKEIAPVLAKLWS